MQAHEIFCQKMVNKVCVNSCLGPLDPLERCEVTIMFCFHWMAILVVNVVHYQRLCAGVNILAFKPTMVGEKFPEIWG